MNGWNSKTRIGPKPWNDGPAGGRKDHDGLLSKSFEGEAHANGSSTPSTGKMATTQILHRRYFYLFHLLSMPCLTVYCLLLTAYFYFFRPNHKISFSALGCSTAY